MDQPVAADAPPSPPGRFIPVDPLFDTVLFGTAVAVRESVDALSDKDRLSLHVARDVRGESLLMCALRNEVDAVDVAHALLDCGFPVLSGSDPTGATAVERALDMGANFLAHRFLCKGASHSLSTVANRSKYWLYAALSNWRAARLLLSFGADPSVMEGENTVLYFAVRDDNAGFVEAAVNKWGKRIVSHSWHHMNLFDTGTPFAYLLRACISCSSRDVFAYLMSLRGEGSHWNVPKSAVAFAARCGDLDLLTRLLDLGLSPNSSAGQTGPLYAAISRSHLAAVRLLLSRGAHPNPPGQYSYLAAAIEVITVEIAEVLIAAGATVVPHADTSSAPLLWAARKNRLDIARVLLAADPHQSDVGRRVVRLAFAAAVSHPFHAADAFVPLLLEHDLGTADACEPAWCPVACAAVYPKGGLRMVNALLERGVCDICNPLHLFCKAVLESAAAVRCLLDAGANPSAPDSSGHAPVVVALGRGFVATAKVLMEYGADIDSAVVRQQILSVLGLLGLPPAPRGFRALADAGFDVSGAHTHLPRDCYQVLVQAGARVAPLEVTGDEAVAVGPDSDIYGGVDVGGMTSWPSAVNGPSEAALANLQHASQALSDYLRGIAPGTESRIPVDRHTGLQYDEVRIAIQERAALLEAVDPYILDLNIVALVGDALFVPWARVELYRAERDAARLQIKADRLDKLAARDNAPPAKRAAH